MSATGRPVRTSSASAGAIAEALGGRRSGDGWVVRCPAHDDDTPSLSIRDGDREPLITCHAGCARAAVIAALRERALWPADSRPHAARTSTTQYVVRDADGSSVAVHHRRDRAGDKQMWWSQPDGTRGLGRTRVADLPLYGCERLADAPPGATVVVVEGERAADALRALGVPAVGTVTGASGTPSDDVLRVLEGRDAVLWPDHDEPGRQHMARIARRLRLVGVRARVFTWPGARDDGDDVVDYVQRGGTREELDALVGAASALCDDVPPPGIVGDDGEGAPASPPGIIAADVRRERAQWLWPGRIPLGKVTIISGDPDRGKTTVMLDVAARVTHGRLMPDGTPGLGKPAGVVVISAEDDAGDTLRPRLEAAEADLSRVLVLRLHELPTIPDGLDVIEAAVERVDARLVTVDPMMAVLGDRIDAHRDHHIRRALTPLAELAARLRVSIVLVRHLNKSQVTTNAQYRGGGSIGITAAARSELLVAPDPDDETGERRILARVKGNLAAPVPSLMYRLVPRELAPLEEDEDQSPHRTVAVEWGGQSERTADQLLAQPADPEERTAVDAAQDYLAQVLAEGPRTSDEVHAGARAAGIARATLWRARQHADVRARRAGWGAWYWSLPESGDTYYPPEAPPTLADERRQAEETAALRLAELIAVADPPITRRRAEDDLLQAAGLSRNRARDLIDRLDGVRWRIVVGGGRGQPTVLRPAAETSPPPVSAYRAERRGTPTGEVSGAGAESPKNQGLPDHFGENGHHKETSPPSVSPSGALGPEIPPGEVSADDEAVEL